VDGLKGGVDATGLGLSVSLKRVTWWRSMRILGPTWLEVIWRSPCATVAAWLSTLHLIVLQTMHAFKVLYGPHQYTDREHVFMHIHFLDLVTDTGLIRPVPPWPSHVLLSVHTSLPNGHPTSGISSSAQVPLWLIQSTSTSRHGTECTNMHWMLYYADAHGVGQCDSVMPSETMNK
jgi:hypothetical protein